MMDMVAKEPRVVSNLWITEQRDAYNVLSDMASVFRSIASVERNAVFGYQDRTSDPVCLYTQSNVVDGKILSPIRSRKDNFPLQWKLNMPMNVTSIKRRLSTLQMI